MSEPFSHLGDVVVDESFPAVDLALRRGRHIHKGDERWYAFLSDARGLLEEFYGRYGYELVHRSDGYFFLLPASEGLGKRHLSVAEMIVGQGLALAYLEPKALERGAVITREELLNQLASAMGSEALLRTLNPKRKRTDERVAQRTARLKVGEALRRLAQLGFVELLEDDQLRLHPSLLRFAEPVRGLEAPAEALRQLLERGEVSLGPGDAETEGDGAEAGSDLAEDMPGEDAAGEDAAGEGALADAGDAPGAEDELRGQEEDGAAAHDGVAEQLGAESEEAVEAESEEAVEAESEEHRAASDREIAAIADDLWSDDPVPPEAPGA